MALKRLTPIVSASREVEELRKLVRLGAWQAGENLNSINLSSINENPMRLLHALKFERMGYNALSGRHPTMVEQLYRTFKVMTILAAADYLLERHQCRFALNFGLTQETHLIDNDGWLKDLDYRMWQIRHGDFAPGSLPQFVDSKYVFMGIHVKTPVVSYDRPDVAAQAFAATSEGSNAALSKNCVSIMGLPVSHRYLFFYAPDEEPGRRLDLEEWMRERVPKLHDHDIEIWALREEEVL